MKNNEKQLKEVLLSIERSQLLISQIISQNTSITVEELKEMFLEAKTLTPVAAKKSWNDSRNQTSKCSRWFSNNFAGLPIKYSNHG